VDEELSEDEYFINYMKYFDQYNLLGLLPFNVEYDENSEKYKIISKNIKRFIDKKSVDKLIISKATNLRIVCPITDIKIYNHTDRLHSIIPFEAARVYAEDILDPIVLLPIKGPKRYNINGNQEYYNTPMYLVLTMWGLESFDCVLNPDGIAKINILN